VARCGLATALIGTPYGIGVGVVGIGLAQNDRRIADQAGIGKGGRDAGVVAAGGLVLVHAFKASAGPVIEEH
jgi:hypothetical protein